MTAGDKPIAFADTNIWLYALIASQDAAKSATSQALIRQPTLVTSVQVINEVCVNLIKKAQFSEERIRELVASFYERHHVAHFEKTTLLKASLLREKHGFSFWDSTMIASALAAGAEIFYSEDMHHGTVVQNSLRLTNPFLATRGTTA
jgi:Predicted nucleic-acid-binding protein, contains PIN domain